MHDEDMVRPADRQRGIAPIAIIAVLGFVVGLIWAFNAKKLAQKNIPVISDLSQKLSSERKHGDAKLTAEGVVDTPYYDDGVTGIDIYDGGVVKRTLKSGITTYFIIPPGEGRVSYAEIAEFSKLPTSSTHIPLYTTYGSGINVAIEGKIINRAYLVFDFSKGKRLEEFKKLAKYINYCDFSIEHFYPEACAALLRVPIDKTTNVKYLAASPKHIQDDTGEDRTVVLLEPTYFLGTDDLLVVEITKTVMIVPQPVTDELLDDLLSDASYVTNYSNELMDLLRLTKRKPNLSSLANSWGAVDVSFKSYLVDRYLGHLYSRAAQAVAKMSEETQRSTFGGRTASYFSDEARYREQDAERTLEKQLSWWNGIRSYRPGLLDVTYAAQLRRAYEAKVKGSAAALFSVLGKTKEAIVRHRQEVDDTVPAEMDLFYAVEVGKVLTGKLRYEKPTGLFGTLYGLPALSVLSQVYAQTGGDSGSSAPDVSDDDQAPPPPSLHPPTEEPDAGTQQAIDEAEKELEKEVKKTLDLITEKLKAGGWELTLTELEKALEVAGNMSEAAWKEFEKKLKELLDEAKTNDQKGKGLKYCQRYFGQLSPEMQERCKKFEDVLVFTLCYIEKIDPLSLANFAKQHGIQIKCKESGGEEEPEKPPPQGFPPPEFEPPEPPLEPIDPNNQPPLEPIGQ